MRKNIAYLLLLILAYIFLMPYIFYRPSIYTIPILTQAYTSNQFGEQIQNVALVLEGGSLRSLYSSGVLDVFMENNIEFGCVIGVSAGALNGANYIANHIGRSARINIMHSNDSNYFGIKQFLLKGSVFNFDYLFYSPIKDLYPYNEEALINSKQKFLIGATNCETGKVVYFERNNYSELVQVLQASSSMPLLSKPVNIDGFAYLDGAISDPIGVHKAFSEGYDKVVVVLTRDFEYRSKNISGIVKFLFRIFYGKYPELIATLDNYPKQYNSLLEEINKMEQEEKIFVIRPSREMNIRDIERDARKLLNLYLQGRDDARALLPRIFEYIN
ncbi:MAG: patatin family protein [Treponema sp.]|jgi:predicted patatin/cPLA2 family phospholipase|nr:patatin family protein [Treponema sp.]